MIINSDTSGLDALQLRLQEMKMLLPGIIRDTAQIAGDAVASELGDAAPVGKGEGSGNPPGDADGPLSESFSAFAEIHANGNSAVAEVRCSQPTKLKFVTQGRGEVLPKVKKALFWPGLDHPVRRAGPAKANDFVSPVLQDVDSIIEPEILDGVDVLSGILEGE